MALGQTVAMPVVTQNRKLAIHAMKAHILAVAAMTERRDIIVSPVNSSRNLVTPERAVS
jgi:hypothetical protein